MRRAAGIAGVVGIGLTVALPPALLDWRLLGPVGLVVLLTLTLAVLLLWAGFKASVTAVGVTAAGLAICTSAVGSATGTPILLPIMVGLLSLGILLSGPARSRILTEAHALVRSTHTSELLGIAFASAIAMGAWLIILAPHSFPLDGPVTTVGADGPLLASIARSIFTDGLSSTPFLAGSPIRYHWLAYGFGGWLAGLSGTDHLVAVMLVVPGILFLLAILCAGAIGRTLSSSPAAYFVSVTATTLVGFVGVWRFAQSSPWEWGSPSTLAGDFFGLLVTLLVVLLWTRFHWVTVALIATNSFAAAAAKSSVGALLAAASLLYLVFRVCATRRLPPLTEIAIPGAIIGGVSTAYLLFLSGTGNNLEVDPFWMLEGLDSANSIFIESSLQFAYLAAAFTGWAGLLTVWATRQLSNRPNLWALAAAVAGLTAYVTLSAPDDNDRFFAIAAATIVVPISTLSFLDLKSSFGLPGATRGSLVGIVITCASLLLGWAAWQPLFDVRPWLFPLVLIGLSAIMGSVLAAGTRDGVEPRPLIAYSGVVLVAFAILVPQALRLFDTQRINTAAGYSPLSILAPAEVAYSGGEIRAAIDASGLTYIDSPLIALAGGSNAQDQDYRWIVYESGARAYVTPDPDLNRLTVATATAVWTERGVTVRDALAGSVGASRLLCEQGVRQIWHVGDPELRTDSPLSLLFDGERVQVFQLECS